MLEGKPRSLLISWSKDPTFNISACAIAALAGFDWVAATRQGRVKELVVGAPLVVLLIDLNTINHTTRSFTKIFWEKWYSVGVWCDTLDPIDTGRYFRDGIMGLIPFHVLRSDGADWLRKIRRSVLEQSNGHSTALRDEWNFEAQRRLLRSPNGNQVRLTKTQGSVLRLLANRSGQCVSREEIHSLLTLDTAATSQRSVDRLVERLRNALETIGAAEFVETIYGEGYALNLALSVIN